MLNETRRMHGWEPCVSINVRQGVYNETPTPGLLAHDQGEFSLSKRDLLRG
jgi:hypothetical protein